MVAETRVQPVDQPAPMASVIYDVIVKGDLSQLSKEQQQEYYLAVCNASGCDPRTTPFEYIKLNGKLVLYAKKGATDQIRSRMRINIVETRFDYPDGLVLVTVTGEDASGRRDTEIGAVPLLNLQGEARANALMKALTKAKRRLTLAMSGLGMLDETEVESMPPSRAQIINVDRSTGEILDAPAAISSGQSEPVPGGISDTKMRALHAYTAAEFKWDHDALHAVAWHVYGQQQASCDEWTMTSLTEEQATDLLRLFNRTRPEEADMMHEAAMDAADDPIHTELLYPVDQQPPQPTGRFGGRTR